MNGLQLCGHKKTGVRFSGTAFMTITEYAKPTQTEKQSKPENWYIELKYDGTRQFLKSKETGVKLYNKRGKDKTRHFPDITDEVTIPEGVVLDGETIVTDELHPHGNKNVLHSRDGGKPVIRKNGGKNFKQKMKMKQYPAKFVAFDILEYKGESMRNEPIEVRRELLEEVVNGMAECVMVSERFNDFKTVWEQVIDKKMEGVILKKPESQYPSGRTGMWQKVKNIKDTILTARDYEEHNKGITVIGEDEESSNHRFTVNGRVSEDVKQEIEENDEPEIEVSYLERSKNGKLREPRFKRITK